MYVCSFNVGMEVCVVCYVMYGFNGFVELLLNVNFLSNKNIGEKNYTAVIDGASLKSLFDFKGLNS